MSHAERQAMTAARKVVREIDGEIAKVKRDAEREVAKLRERRAKWEALADPSGVPARRGTRTRPSSQQIAGKAAIEAVAGYLREHGEAFQSEITEALGLNSGTVTHALRALADQVVATGERSSRNSAKFAWAGVRDQEREAVAA